MEGIRRCRGNERETVLEIVNAAAEAYRGVIPDDCWHEPYMSLQELGSETWRTFAAWYQERAKEGNWQQLDDVPFEDLKTVVSKLENDLAVTPA